MYLKSILLVFILNFISLNANYYKNFKQLVRFAATRPLQYNHQQSFFIQKKYTLSKQNFSTKNFYSKQIKLQANIGEKKKITFDELFKLKYQANQYLKKLEQVPIEYDDEVLGFLLERLDPNKPFEDIEYAKGVGQDSFAISNRMNLYKTYNFTYLYFLLTHSDLLHNDYAKHLFYYALQNKDYLIIFILLRLGVNIYQEITVNNTKYRLIDFADSYIKSIIKESVVDENILKYQEVYENNIKFILGCHEHNLVWASVSIDFLKYLISYKNKDMIVKIFSKLIENNRIVKPNLGFYDDGTSFIMDESREKVLLNNAADRGSEILDAVLSLLNNMKHRF